MIKKLSFVLVLLYAIRSMCDSSINREILCNRVEGKIVVDGIINEPAWEKAVPLNFVKIVSLDEPIFATMAYCLYDKNYIYFAFFCQDRDIWATLKNRDSQLWDQDVVEIFLKPDSSDDSFYEFQISPKNTVLDAFVLRRLREKMFTRFAEWNCAGLKSSVKIKGTLNNWFDDDNFWSVEVAIPFKSLLSNGRMPARNDVWLINLGRYDYSVYLEKGFETSTSCPIKKFDFHRYEEWSFLKFN
ncbi:MAG: carbohydrate-binding family 9-like protein [Candidatus Omnitrophica bacterium]|nr:carbohydrate-binding family 9-like protein [Candidatus Omnitrophota bacterium]MCM8829036.1 carbohydrate-binding family 9-like protein [Candidatus Omnitrophota bacterium]